MSSESMWVSRAPAHFKLRPTFNPYLRRSLYLQALPVAAEGKIKEEFEGNVVDLGSKYSPYTLDRMFGRLGGGRSTFTFPDEGKPRIVGCATKEDLSTPSELDSDGHSGVMVGKVGNTTGLTVGRYAGLVSFARNEVGIRPMELGIYNSGDNAVELFSGKGDSWLSRLAYEERSSSHCWPIALWTKWWFLEQQSCHILHPWLVPPGRDQEEI